MGSEDRAGAPPADPRGMQARLRLLRELDLALAAEQPAGAIARTAAERLRELLGAGFVVVERASPAGGASEAIAAAGSPAPPSALVPLVAGGERVGAIGFAGATLHPDESAALAQEVGVRLALALRHERVLGRLEEAHARLAALNGELESFSYSVSHDLRAPLRAIDGYARMLERESGERMGEEGRRLLGVVRASAHRMGRLIDDLLEFSRIVQAQPARSTVDMTALAREVAAELGRDYPGTEIRVSELPGALGDRALLRQVWLNLIGNALKFSARRALPRVEIGGRAEAALVRFWVLDNGVGFEMRYAGRLFGVFQRLHRQEEFAGTGVGLAIARHIVVRHGGRIEAEGEPNRGARFSFVLPSA